MKSLGIIGCGAVTQRLYVKALSMYNDISVDAVFDIKPELAALVAGQLSATVVTKEELLAKSDIVIICTPPSTHFNLVQEALTQGKKVVCEKPFVGLSKEAVFLADLAHQRGAELYVAHFRRNFPSVQMARSIIKSKVLGDVKAIEVYEGGKFSWVTASGYVYNDPFGGVLFDTGSHTIDMALFMANIDIADLSVEALSIIKDKPEPAHDINANLKLHANDATIDLKVRLSRKDLLSNKVRIICSNGYIDVPAGIAANYIRITGQSGSTIVHSGTNYEDLMDCFASQFKGMFYDTVDSVYAASRFINLTKVLEKIAND
jgi:predicted dehydrogenase